MVEAARAGEARETVVAARVTAERVGVPTVAEESGEVARMEVEGAMAEMMEAEEMAARHTCTRHGSEPRRRREIRLGFHPTRQGACSGEHCRLKASR